MTVIGVLQPAPFFPAGWTLLNMVVSEHHLSAFMVEGRTHRMTEMVARLAPGATLREARTEVAAVIRPDAERHIRRRTTPARTIASRSFRSRKCWASAPS